MIQDRLDRAEPRTADDFMATEYHRERAREWRTGGPAPTQFDDDEPNLADEADAVEGSEWRAER